MPGGYGDGRSTTTSVIGTEVQKDTDPVKLADAEVLRSHEGRESTSGLSSPGQHELRSWLLDLYYISTCSRTEEEHDLPSNRALGPGNPEPG